MSLSRTLKNSFVGGIILIAPLAVTVYVVTLLVNWTLGFVDPIVAGTRLTQYTANDEITAQVVTVLIILTTVTVLGFLAQKSVGQSLFGSIGRVVNFVPLVSVIYGSVRQVATSLVDRDTGYESVVLVEYPREGIYSIGLVTGESPDAVEPVTGRPAYNVFLPNSPNPTAGRLVLLPEDEVHEIDMSVRRGLRMVVTTGMGDQEDIPSLPKMEAADRDAGDQRVDVTGDGR